MKPMSDKQLQDLAARTRTAMHRRDAFNLLRPLLEHDARRRGVEIPHSTLVERTAAKVDELCDSFRLADGSNKVDWEKMVAHLKLQHDEMMQQQLQQGEGSDGSRVVDNVVRSEFSNFWQTESEHRAVAIREAEYNHRLEAAAAKYGTVRSDWERFFAAHDAAETMERTDAFLLQQSKGQGEEKGSSAAAAVVFSEEEMEQRRKVRELLRQREMDIHIQMNHRAATASKNRGEREGGEDSLADVPVSVAGAHDAKERVHWPDVSLIPQSPSRLRGNVPPPGRFHTTVAAPFSKQKTKKMPVGSYRDHPQFKLQQQSENDATNVTPTASEQTTVPMVAAAPHSQVGTNGSSAKLPSCQVGVSSAGANKMSYTREERASEVAKLRKFYKTVAPWKIAHLTDTEVDSAILSHYGPPDGFKIMWKELYEKYVFPEQRQRSQTSGGSGSPRPSKKGTSFSMHSPQRRRSSARPTENLQNTFDSLPSFSMLPPAAAVPISDPASPTSTIKSGTADEYEAQEEITSISSSNSDDGTVVTPAVYRKWKHRFIVFYNSIVPPDRRKTNSEIDLLMKKYMSGQAHLAIVAAQREKKIREGGRLDDGDGRQEEEVVVKGAPALELMWRHLLKKYAEGPDAICSDRAVVQLMSTRNQDDDDDDDDDDKDNSSGDDSSSTYSESTSLSRKKRSASSMSSMSSTARELQRRTASSGSLLLADEVAAAAGRDGELIQSLFTSFCRNFALNAQIDKLSAFTAPLQHSESSLSFSSSPSAMKMKQRSKSQKYWGYDDDGEEEEQKEEVPLYKVASIAQLPNTSFWSSSALEESNRLRAEVRGGAQNPVLLMETVAERLNQLCNFLSPPLPNTSSLSRRSLSSDRDDEAGRTTATSESRSMPTTELKIAVMIDNFDYTAYQEQSRGIQKQVRRALEADLWQALGPSMNKFVMDRAQEVKKLFATARAQCEARLNAMHAAELRAKAKLQAAGTDPVKIAAALAEKRSRKKYGFGTQAPVAALVYDFGVQRNRAADLLARIEAILFSPSFHRIHVRKILPPSATALVEVTIARGSKLVWTVCNDLLRSIEAGTFVLSSFRRSYAADLGLGQDAGAALSIVGGCVFGGPSSTDFFRIRDALVRKYKAVYYIDPHTRKKMKMLQKDVKQHRRRVKHGSDLAASLAPQSGGDSVGDVISGGTALFELFEAKPGRRRSGSRASLSSSGGSSSSSSDSSLTSLGSDEERARIEKDARRKRHRQLKRLKAAREREARLFGPYSYEPFLTTLWFPEEERQLLEKDEEEDPRRRIEKQREEWDQARWHPAMFEFNDSERKVNPLQSELSITTAADRIAAEKKQKKVQDGGPESLEKLVGGAAAVASTGMLEPVVVAEARAQYRSIFGPK